MKVESNLKKLLDDIEREMVRFFHSKRQSATTEGFLMEGRGEMITAKILILEKGKTGKVVMLMDIPCMEENGVAIPKQISDVSIFMRQEYIREAKFFINQVLRTDMKNVLKYNFLHLLPLTMSAAA